RPTLILKLASNEFSPDEWEISDSPVGIGRLDSEEVTIPHRSVSRQHARIVPTPAGFTIEDRGSANGTWLNDKPITERTPLNDGDTLMIGDVPLVVEIRQPRVPTPVVAPVAPPAQPVAWPVEVGPATVFYDVNEALAAASPPANVSRTSVAEVT